jgi:hypothetical protein
MNKLTKESLQKIIRTRALANHGVCIMNYREIMRLFVAQSHLFEVKEPTYSMSLKPYEADLVALQKRLNSFDKMVAIGELRAAASDIERAYSRALDAAEILLHYHRENYIQHLQNAIRYATLNGECLEALRDEHEELEAWNHDYWSIALTGADEVYTRMMPEESLEARGDDPNEELEMQARERGELDELRDFRRFSY